MNDWPERRSLFERRYRSRDHKESIQFETSSEHSILHPRAESSLFTFAILFCVIFVALPQARGQAPTSQPTTATEGEVSAFCGNSWEQGEGREGECEVRTDVSSWTLRYYLEGQKKRTLKGKVKNLLVLFHPDGYTHLVRDWWGRLIGEGKPIDTNEYLVLSIGSPDNGNPPKSGSPIFLSVDEILKSSHALVHRLFPGRRPYIDGVTDYIVGGASRGGLAAYLYAMEYGDEIAASFHVTAHPLYPEWSGQDVIDLVEGLRVKEMERGPYAFWSEEEKKNFWMQLARLDVEESMSNAIYRHPEKLKIWGLDISEEKEPSKLKDALTEVWAKSYVEYTDPIWWGARFRAYDEVTKELKPADFSKLPDEMLVIHNSEDQIFKPEDVKKFVKLVRDNNSDADVRRVEVHDMQGHNVCCSAEMPEKMLSAVRAFLNP